MHKKSLLLASATVGTIVLSLMVACGSSDNSTFGNGDDGGSSGGFTDGLADSNPDSGDPYANDKPPPSCPAPTTVDCCKMPNPPTPPIGGTPECPDDKNKPGCSCKSPGMTAPCWTGLRKNRNLGVCKDGMTTCMMVSETASQWGPCVGEVLPTPGATKGAQACGCFSAGQWLLANLSPCFYDYCNSGQPKCDPGSTTSPAGCCSDATADHIFALSTVVSGMTASCPDFATYANPPGGNSGPPQKPPGPWTTTQLKVDCTGHFHLCFELKAGDKDNPKPTDCSLAKICTEGDYTTAGALQDFGSLDSWTTTSETCARQWDMIGGYGEMTVLGESTACESIDDGSGGSFVFNRIKYCPAKCRGCPSSGSPDCSSAECTNCQMNGSGMF